jgi:signal transduction histidine kinase/CheY-like chemotaxis protein
LLDPQGRILLCNQAAARFFQEVSGVQADQLSGMDIWQQCPEVADSTFAKESRQAEQEQRAFQTETYFPSLRRWFAFHGAPVPAGLCVSVQDVTDRIELERSLRSRAGELVEANRGKEDFLLQLAHELRNCLAPIRNALHLWSANGCDDGDQDGARQMAENELQHISRLLEDLLKLARLAPSDTQPRLTRLDLGDVVAHSLHTMLATPAARGRRFAVHLPSEPLTIEGDRDMLEKMLLHLLDNAVRYTRPGGHITLEVVGAKHDAVLRVRDDGIGISADMLPRIFNLFMRPDRPGGRLQGGVGVGLALVRRLVELHGGRVEAHSEGPGKGSEFIVRLPALAETNAAPLADQSPVRILVVDDCRQAAESLALLLRLWGYEVRMAFDPQSALEDARAHPPRVVLLDIGMPGMDGYEVARRLREQDESRNALLVAITGYGEADDRRRAMGAGFDFHMVKPADPDDLRELLKLAGSYENLNVPAAT